MGVVRSRFTPGRSPVPFAILLLAACALHLGAPLARAGEDAEPAPVAGPWLRDDGAIQRGRDGTARWLVRPEFRAAHALKDQLRAFPVEDVHVELAPPRVMRPALPGKKEPPPPVLSRLLVTGPYEGVVYVRDLVRRLDAPRRSVFVSILVAEVQRTLRHSSGGSMLFDRDAIPKPRPGAFRGFGMDFEPEDYLRTSLTGIRPFEGTSLQFGDASVLGGAFELTLRMLLKRGDAEFLAWPNLLCDEEMPGVLESVRKVPRILFSSGSPANPRVKVLSEEVGLRLRVTPLRIGTDDAVLDLDVWLRFPEQVEDASSPVGTLRLNTRQVRTRLTVHDREPLLLGGLHVRRKGDVRRGLPHTQSVPVLDPLLSTRGRDGLDSEIVFLLRARVVQAGRLRR